VYSFLQNIVAFYGISLDFASTGMKVCTVMELCEGSLADRLRDTSIEMSWAEKLEISCKIAHGLSYLHQKAIVHRDLKPGNVLMGADNTPKVPAPFGPLFFFFLMRLFRPLLRFHYTKIADFGTSREHDKNAVTSMTANIGTPVYMAPELMSDSNYSNHIETNGRLLDVYSFGVMLWEILAREKPYEQMARQRHLNLWALRDMILDGQRPTVEGNTALINAPEKVLNLMRECWQDSPEKRPSSFDEISQRLDEAMTTLPAEGTSLSDSAMVVNPMLQTQEEQYA
jgi:serine/threonine protein kinase